MPDQGTTTPDLAQATLDLQLALDRFQEALRSAKLPRPEGGSLYTALRAWRTEQARTRQVPPYIIATDAVLRAIEEARPRDLDQLVNLRGIGASKAATYGPQILEVVAKATT